MLHAMDRCLPCISISHKSQHNGQAGNGQAADAGRAQVHRAQEASVDTPGRNSANLGPAPVTTVGARARGSDAMALASLSRVRLPSKRYVAWVGGERRGVTRHVWQVWRMVEVRVSGVRPPTSYNLQFLMTHVLNRPSELRGGTGIKFCPPWQSISTYA